MKKHFQETRQYNQAVANLLKHGANTKDVPRPKYFGANERNRKKKRHGRSRGL